MFRLLGIPVALFAASLACAQASSPVQAAPEMPTQRPSAVLPAQPVPPPDPSSPVETLEAKGDELRGQALYGDALDYYRAALRKEPKRAMLWNKMGLAELRLARYENARKYFEKAIKTDRTFSDAVGNLGATYYLQGVQFFLQKENSKAQKQYSKAIKTCRKAIEMRPDIASFHNNLANAYFSHKEYENAMREFSRALELDPDILERRSKTGIQAQVVGAEDRARYAFELARVYAHAGNLDRALHYLRQAMEDGFTGIDSVYHQQEFAGLRKDPRFAELMNSRPQAIPQ